VHALARGWLTRRTLAEWAAGTGLAAFVVVAAARLPQESLAVAAILAALAILPTWMLLSERYELTLGVLLLYLGLADGFLKLSLDNQLAAAGRDVLFGSIVLGAVLRLLVRHEQIKLPPLAWYPIAFTSIVLVQLANPSGYAFVHNLAALRPHLGFVAMFAFGFVVLRTKQRLRGYLVLLCLVAAINGVVSLVQFELTPDELASWGPGYANRIYGVGVAGRTFTDLSGVSRTRPFGLGSDIAFAGILAALAAPALLALMSLARRRWAGRIGVLLGAGIVLGIITGQSRSAVLGAILGVVAFAIFVLQGRGRLTQVVVLASVAIATLSLINVVAGSSGGRALSRYEELAPSRVFNATYEYRKGTFVLIPTTIKQYPFGAGLGSVGPATSFARSSSATVPAVFNSESQANFLLIELGLPGFLVFLVYHLRLLTLLPRIRAVQDPELRTLLAGTLAPVVALAGLWIAGPISAGTPGSPIIWLSGGAIAYWLAGPGRADARAKQA
jgi:hypothetical protein